MKFAIISNIITCAICCIFVLSCSKRNSHVYIDGSDDLSLEDIKQQIQEEEAQKAQLEKEKEAKALAEKRAKQAEMLANKMLREQMLKEQAAAAKAEADRLADIKRRQEEQKDAFANFKDTEYDELTLPSGRVLVSAKATKIDPVKVTFVHRDGVSNIKFMDLPEKVRVACKFDEELMVLELEGRNPTDSNLAESRAKLAESQARLAKARAEGTDEENKSVELAKGSIGKVSVKILDDTKAFKTIQVVAESSVDAKLYLNDLYYHRRYAYEVKAGQSYTHDWRNVGDKYEIKLVAEDSGEILAQESKDR